LNKNQYNIIQSKYKDDIIKEDFPYSCEYCILDWREGIVMLYSPQKMRNKTFPLFKGNTKGNKKGVGKYDLSFLEPYKTDDKSIFIQSDKVVPSLGTMEQIYAIDHIWLAYVYITKSGILRMCLNSNLFGVYKLIGSREMNINEILLHL
jgi:hypothetical protein